MAFTLKNTATDRDTTMRPTPLEMVFSYPLTTFHNILPNFLCYVLFTYCLPKISFYAASRPKFNFRGYLTIKYQLLKLRNRIIFVFTWWKFWLLTGYLHSSGKFLFTFCFCMWNFWCNVIMTLENDMPTSLYRKLKV